MRKLLSAVTAAAFVVLAVASEARAQTTIVLAPGSAIQFDPSPDHNATFAGTSVVTKYRATYCLKADAAQCPVVVDLGKPTPDATTGKITVVSVFGGILPNTEYTATVVAVGPNGVSVPSNTTDPFGVPAVPRPPVNVQIKQ